jgi:hypothetical protein
LFYCMQTPEKTHLGGSQLFKMFSLRGENPLNTPIVALLSDNKPSQRKPTEDSVRSAEPARGRVRAASDEN